MKPATPKGTRDFGPAQMRKRQYLFAILRRHFELAGFEPIETPAMENLETLTGKYGDEGDQLLFKILNNGDFLAKADEQALENRDSKGVLSSISKRGLRYDLTVPFARFVVQYRNDIELPFKRYAIQPVWRADRPQKGRYQEFFQCDADVVGSDSLICEAELMRLFDSVFAELGLKVVIRINHREVLEGICELYGFAERLGEFSTSLDKLDKIGQDAVVAELVQRGFEEEAAASALQSIAGLEDLQGLEALFSGLDQDQAGTRGLQAMKRLFALCEQLGMRQRMKYDASLARGLSYYTGCIFEVVVDTDLAAQSGVKMGSIGGGGRYANLTEAFGGRDMSGVGISFGAERIYDVLEELNLWPERMQGELVVLLAALDEASLDWAFAKTDELRQAGIAAACYPDLAKPKKSLGYALQKQVPFFLLIGDREREEGVFRLKNLAANSEMQGSFEEILGLLIGYTKG